MYKVTRFVPMLLAFLFALAVGVSLAGTPAKSNSTTKNAAAATKAKPSATTTAMKSKTESSKAESRKTESKKTESRKTSRALASSEDLSGTITNVDATDREVTILGSNGVSYDFRVTPRTLVELSNNKIRTNQMTQLVNESQKQATIRFVPMSNGNLAKNIQISAS